MPFHVSNLSYLPGTVIAPGHWGSSIRSYRPGGPMPTPENIGVVLWEVALETARLSIGPQLPSRLDGVFASPDLAASQRFRDTYRPGGTIFEVEIVGSPATFLGDFSLISSGIEPVPYADYMSTRARQYWTSTSPNDPEMIIAGSLRVLSALAV